MEILDIQGIQDSENDTCMLVLIFIFNTYLRPIMFSDVYSILMLPPTDFCLDKGIKTWIPLPKLKLTEINPNFQLWLSKKRFKPLFHFEQIKLDVLADSNCLQDIGIKRDYVKITSY